MMTYLGGPETSKQLDRRHERYVAMAALPHGGVFTVRSATDGRLFGTVGFWETTWQGEPIFETGWQVFPEHAGRGIATRAALAVIARAREDGSRRFLHAFPNVEKVASNRVCARAGFVFRGACDFDYPKGHPMRCHDWRVDLFARDAAR